MATKIIENQQWEEMEKYMAIKLYEPFWGAWKKFGWDYGVFGMSISKKAIEYARELKKKLLIDLGKYGKFEISGDKALVNGKPFFARNRVQLICVPKTAFKRL